MSNSLRLSSLGGLILLLAAPLRAAALPPGATLPESGPAMATPVRIDIDAGTVLHTVDERNFHGINFVALWNDTGDSPGTVKAFSQMGMGLVRFPGGCPAEWYDWKEPLATGWTELTPERAWAFAKAGGAKMVFQTNAATDKTDKNKKTGDPYTLSSSAAHAADWVADARKKAISVAFWEIGNEPEMDAPGQHKKTQEAVYAWYNAKFAEQVAAIKKIDPAAKAMGPAACNTWFWWHEKNLEKFMKAHGNKEGSGLVDAVSLHWYLEGGSGSWEQKRGGAQGWEKCMDYIRGAIKQYDTRDLPLYITEWNWGAGDKCDGAKRMSNALGTADCIGMFLRTGVAGHQFFCLQKIGRGWGVLAMKQDCRPQNEAAPTYYALCLASKLGGKVLSVKNGADEANVLSAYATRHADGSLQVMLINKSASPVAVTLGFTGYTCQGKRVQTWTLAGAKNSAADTDVVFNGMASPAPSQQELPKPQVASAAAATVTHELKPCSMAVLVFDP